MKEKRQINLKIIENSIEEEQRERNRINKYIDKAKRDIELIPITPIGIAKKKITQKEIERLEEKIRNIDNKIVNQNEIKESLETDFLSNEYKVDLLILGGYKTSEIAQMMDYSERQIVNIKKAN